MSVIWDTRDRHWMMSLISADLPLGLSLPLNSFFFIPLTSHNISKKGEIIERQPPHGKEDKGVTRQMLENQVLSSSLYYPILA